MNNLREIAQKFKQFFLDKVNVFENEPLSKHDSFKVGGNAKLFVEPLTLDAFFDVLNFLESEKVSYFILGGGTNTVFSDNDFDSIVISTVKLNKITSSPINDQTSEITAECGSLMNTIVNYATTNCLTGLEEFCGLPGTVGGACFMNARCFNLSMSNVIKSIEYFEKIDSNKNTDKKIYFEKKTYIFNKDDWDYKISPFCANQHDQLKKSKIIACVTLKTKKLDNTKENILMIKNKAADFLHERIEKGHFKFPSAGSVFKNNHLFGKPTGQIIDELGLKGKTIGGAQVAPFHGNIIINKNNATQSDIKQLVDYIKNEALKKYNFNLEEEIIFI